MIESPKLVLDVEAVEVLLGLSAAVRKSILVGLDQLRHERPQMTEDFAETDPSGRHISVKGIRPVLVRYWLDGPVNEMRVIRITVLKPWSR